MKCFFAKSLTFESRSPLLAPAIRFIIKVFFCNITFSELLKIKPKLAIPIF